MSWSEKFPGVTAIRHRMFKQVVQQGRSKGGGESYSRTVSLRVKRERSWRLVSACCQASGALPGFHLMPHPALGFWLMATVWAVRIAPIAERR